MTSSSCLRCGIPIGWRRKWLSVSGLFPPPTGLAQQLDTILPLGSWIFDISWILTNIFQLLNVMALYRTYNPKEAITLDRFVYKLTGRDNEVIERKSTQSAMTMKEAGITLEMSVKSLLGVQHISIWNSRKTISGWLRMWNQIRPIWLGVDFPTTFFCRGIVDC